MFEIAYAAASNRICFFTGTGFSKAVTDKKAPSWQGLLEELIGLLPNAKEKKAALFPEDGKNPLTLEESAQVIAIELSSIGLNIHTETAKLIESVELSGEIAPITEFMTKRSFRAVTTNYDKLLEKSQTKVIVTQLHQVYPYQDQYLELKFTMCMVQWMLQIIWS